jgi:hypothetical protein
MSPYQTILQSRSFYRSSGRLRRARRNKAFSLPRQAFACGLELENTTVRNSTLCGRNF